MDGGADSTLVVSATVKFVAYGPELTALRMRQRTPLISLLCEKRCVWCRSNYSDQTRGDELVLKVWNGTRMSGERAWLK